jgi:hypothetical protein
LDPTAISISRPMMAVAHRVARRTSTTLILRIDVNSDGFPGDPRLDTVRPIDAQAGLVDVAPFVLAVAVGMFGAE